MPSDNDVVNCVCPHPRDVAMLAASGIDDDIKIWEATNDENVPPPCVAGGADAEDFLQHAGGPESYEAEWRSARKCANLGMRHVPYHLGGFGMRTFYLASDSEGEGDGMDTGG